MSPTTSAAVIFASMGVVALFESVIPLHARGRWGRAHVIPNLTLTGGTLASTTAMNVVLVLALIGFQERDLGLLNAVALPSLAVFSLALGASPGAFALYRIATALVGLLEHANLRAPLALDRVLALVTTWPHMHKLHHSRVRAETDSNDGNLFSFWDRLFGTYTPSRLGTRVSYGLDGLDDPDTQTTRGLLALPFRDATRARAPRASAARVP